MDLDFTHAIKQVVPHKKITRVYAFVTGRYCILLGSLPNHKEALKVNFIRSTGKYEKELLKFLNYVILFIINHVIIEIAYQNLNRTLNITHLTKGHLRKFF